MTDLILEMRELAPKGRAAVLTLNRPDVLNALSFALLDTLEATLDEVAASDARVLIVRGAGERAFCAGADIKELRGRDLMATKRGAERGQALFSRVEALPMPSIALVNGYAFGGGLELAMACTFRLATPNAKVGLPEIKLGLIPGYGGTQRLPALVGEARALEMVMTGRAVDAAEALAMGLLHRVLETAEAEAALAAALEFAATFAGHSLPVLGFARRAVQAARNMPLHEGLKTEAELSTLAYQTRDAAEGMAAFEEKRAAEFTDA